MYHHQYKTCKVTELVFYSFYFVLLFIPKIKSQLTISIEVLYRYLGIHSYDRIIIAVGH